MFTRAKILRNLSVLLDASPLKQTLFKSALKSETNFLPQFYFLQHRRFNTSAGQLTKENSKGQKKGFEDKSIASEQPVSKSSSARTPKQEEVETGESLKRKSGRSRSRQDGKRALQNRYRNLYSFVMLRVLSTCKLYLSFSQEEVKQITEKSRFYKVMNELEKMTEEEKKEFGDYMEEYNTYIWQPKVTRKTKTNAFDDEFADGEKGPLVIDRNRSSKNYTASRVKKFLQNPKHGGRMSKMVLEFLDKNNPDFQLYLQLEGEERKPGVIVPHRSKLGETSRTTLRTDLEKFKMLYSKMLKRL